jgi:hypothetical protein
MDVPAGRALVYVYRPDALDGPGTLPLYANSERVGDLPRDSYCLLEVEPGELLLDFPFGDGATSLRMDVAAGRRYYVRQDVERRETAKELHLKIQTAKLAPVDEDVGRAALGALLTIATVRGEAAALPDPGGPPPPGRARVVVFRRRWWGEAVRLQVVVNGRSLGGGAARSVVVADARPGRVDLTVTGSEPARLSLDLAPGDEAFVEAVPRQGLFGPKFELRRVDAARAREAIAGLRVATRVEL